MPKIVWTPRTYDPRELFDRRDTWSGYGFILDDDKLTQTPLMVSNNINSADVGGGTYVAQEICNSTLTKSGVTYGALLSRNGSGLWKLFDWTDPIAASPQLGALGGEISTAPTGAITFNAYVTGFTRIPMIAWTNLVSYIGYDSGIAEISHSALPSTATTLVTIGQPMSLAKHLTRLVAVKSDGTVKWSVAGSPTDWTTTTSGAGETLLNDAEGAHSVFVIDNKLVVVSPKSIHYGYLTGTINPVYRFERVYDGECIANYNWSTCARGGAIYSLGDNGLWRFREGQLENIGLPVWKHHMKAGYRSPYSLQIGNWIEPITETDVRPWQTKPHLFVVPIAFNNSTQYATPVLMYNILDGNWNAFYPSGTSNNNWNTTYYSDINGGGLGMLGYQSNIRYHFAGTGVISQSFMLKSPQMLAEDPMRDYTSDFVLLSYINTGVITNVSVVLRAQQANTAVTKTIVVSLGTVGADGRVLHKRIPMRGVVGNTFQLDISGSGTSASKVIVMDAQIMMLDGGVLRSQ